MITTDLLEDFQNKFNRPCKNRASKHAIAHVGIKEASLNQEAIRKHNFVFSEETIKGQITDQKKSGRCWMFAALNTYRADVMKELNVESFEFSQAYPLFWDKLERANYFLESIIETVDQDLDSRLVWHLLQNPTEDGGQWEMFAGLLKKYGAVPKEVMPETFHSSNTSALNDIINNKCREYAANLRKMAADGASVEELQLQKDQDLYFFYDLLVKALGNPPERFTYSYRDKDDHYHKIENIRPQDFFQCYTHQQLDDMVSLIHAPTQDKPFGKTFTVKYLGSIHEADPVKYLNVPIEVLKESAIAAIQDNQPVWFGCDVGKMSNSQLGIMDTDLYAYEDTLADSLHLSKEDRLDYGVSLLTHAMVLVGVDLDEEEQAINWKVENSWGKKSGRDGIFSMSDAWFDEHTYQVSLPREYVPEKWLQNYETESNELEPWDPMGSLALLK